MDEPQEQSIIDAFFCFSPRSYIANTLHPLGPLPQDDSMWLGEDNLEHPLLKPQPNQEKELPIPHIKAQDGILLTGKKIAPKPSNKINLTLDNFESDLFSNFSHEEGGQTERLFINKKTENKQNY